MRKIFITLIIFSSLLLSCTKSLISLHNKFDSEIESGNLKKAKKTLKKISSIESQNYLTMLKSAVLYSEQGNLDAAKIYITKAIDYCKENPIAYTEEFQRERKILYQVSISIYDKIIESEANDANYCNRGILKKDVGLVKESLVDFSKSIQLDSMDYIAYYNRGLAYRKLNLLDSAILDYTRCSKLNPKYGSAYINHGFALLEKNEYELAIKEFQLALKTSENDKGKSFALNNMGFAYYKLKKYDLGYQFVKESLAIYPTNSYAYRNLALIDIALSDFQSACRNIKESKDLGFVYEYGDEITQLEDKYCK